MQPPPLSLSPESLISHAGFVRNLSRSLLLDPGAADDVAQETWITALERPPRSLESLRGWLASVARSLARQRTRGEERRTRREAVAARAERIPSAAEVVEREALRSAVVQAVLALPEPSRTTVLLRFYEEKSPREIAALLRVPVETVRTRLKRGLARLRDVLDARVGGERGDWRHAVVPLAHAGASTLQTGVGVKLALAAGAVVLGAVGWRAVQSSTSSPAQTEVAAAALEPPATARAQEPEPSGAREAVAGEHGGVAPAAAEERALSGRVVDPRGLAPSGASVYVSSSGPPPEGFFDHPEWLAKLRSEGAHLEMLHADSAGGFQGEFEDLARVYVAVIEVSGAGDAYLLPDPAQHRWVELPASDVVLRVADAPTAEVCVQARSGETGALLQEFTCGLRRTSDGRVLRAVEASAGRACALVPFDPRLGIPDEFDVVVETAPGGRAATRVSLSPGEHRELELELEARALIEGRVVDPDGGPVEGALVFSGTQIRMRGDEPYKPFLPERVQDGARTDASGFFAIAGTGRHVTVWHERWSPRTVKREEAALVELGARSSIRGRLLQPDGRPASGVAVALDRARKTTTDELGSFVFEEVEAGVRGLVLPEKRYVGLVVAPGETLEVELGNEEYQDLSLPVQRGGSPAHESFEGALIGMGPEIDFREFGAEGGTLRVEAIPGRYLLLSRSGALAVVEVVTGGIVELGTTPLTVRAEPGTRVYLVPSGANELLELMAGRVASRTAPAEGLVEYAGLPRGRYGIGIDREGVQTEVEIGDLPVEVVLE